MIKIKTKKEWEIYEKGFDDGYNVAISAYQMGVNALKFGHRLINKYNKKSCRIE